jgi:hypothetical protein
MCGSCNAAATLISRANRSAENALREFRRKHLHHDAPVERGVGGDKDARHAATQKFALEGVRRAQRRLQLLPEVAHRDTRSGPGASKSSEKGFRGYLWAIAAR